VVVALQPEFLGDVVQGVDGVCDAAALHVQYKVRGVEHAANFATGWKHNAEGRHHRVGCVVGVRAHVDHGEVAHGHQRVRVNSRICVSVAYVLVNPVGVGKLAPEGLVHVSVDRKERGVVGVVPKWGVEGLDKTDVPQHAKIPEYGVRKSQYSVDVELAEATPLGGVSAVVRAASMEACMEDALGGLGHHASRRGVGKGGVDL
jgi:hypothetical protein